MLNTMLNMSQHVKLWWWQADLHDTQATVDPYIEMGDAEEKEQIGGWVVEDGA